MAISRMQKVSLVFPKAQLDTILQFLQAQQGVQVRDLEELPDWQVALGNQEVQSLAGQADLGSLQTYHQELELAIQKLSAHQPKQGMLASMRQAKPELDLASLEDFGQNGQGQAILEKVQGQLRRLQELEDQIDKTRAKVSALEKWQSLTTTPKALKGFSHLRALIGTVPNSEDDSDYRGIQADPALQLEKVFHSETEHGLIVFTANRDLDLPTYLADAYAFKVFDYDKDILPSEQLAIWTEQKEADLQEKEVILAYLQEAKPDLEDLQRQLDYSLSLQARQESKAKLASTENLTALEGWMEADQVERLKVGIQSKFGQAVYLSAQDVDETDWDNVPIKLKNNKFVEPFETVTEMYALPKYYEKDPTPILAPLYFVFFGMMVADIGYGVVVFLATWAALKFLHLDKGMTRFMKFFNLLGISTTLWGLIYGSFFGFELPVKLISTTTDVMTILVMSVAFGFITLLIGLFLGGQQKLKMKDYASAYNDGFAWCMILLGVLLLVLGMFIPGFAILKTIGSWLAIINAVGIVVVSVISSKSLAGLGSGLYNLYNASGYVGDLVSFTRLMALGLSGASIGSAFNLIVTLIPPMPRIVVGTVLFIILHLVNLFLSLLSGYVHGARLIFVELFGKFYEGGGKAFQPLKPAETYVNIKKETHLEEK
ncbi:V-type ATP synthase subunit I [Streptococcus caprae]|uniref:V-type ATP synthase subunit I n=1 Tax=Streptococcus caprae TaxID=1640501 RepID=A0ABV8CUS4_9STRE